jgi:acyl-CoA thioesterase I
MVTVRLTWILVGAALLFGCSAQPQQGGGQPPSASAPAGSSSTHTVTGPVRYLALGDSVTSGEGVQPDETYPGQLAHLWQQSGCTVELNNMAVTGYKSADVVTEELPAVATFKPTLVTLMVGGNDIANGVGADEYRKNVRTILVAAKTAGARVVTISQQFWDRTPVGEGYGTREELSAKRADFNAVLVAEGEAVGAQYVDLGALFEEQANKKMWLDDHLHPTAEAYRGWASELSAKIDKPCGR